MNEDITSSPHPRRVATLAQRKANKEAFRQEREKIAAQRKAENKARYQADPASYRPRWRKSP